MREFDLRLPVARWMIARGLTPIMEMYSMNNCDMVGFLFADKKALRIVAVELKLSDIKGVTAQMRNHVGAAHEIWAAMPLSVCHRFSRQGYVPYGILAVTDEARIVKPSEEFVLTNFHRVKSAERSAWRRRGEYLERMQDRQMRRWHREPLTEAVA